MSALRLNLTSPPAFSNGFTVTKDWNSTAWSDGGGDTFDNWGFAQIGGQNFALPVPAVNAADGVIAALAAAALPGNGQQLYTARLGWPVAGIFVLEVISGSAATDPYVLTWGGNMGHDGATQMGTVSRTVNIGGTDYRVDTTWINDGAQDLLTLKPQATCTLIPLLASEALPAGTPGHTSTRSGDITSHTSRSLQRGFTWVVQWGQATVSDVQDWIAAALTLDTDPLPDLVATVTGLSPMGQVVGFAPTWPAPVRLLDAPQMLRRVDYGGNGRIRGTVKIKGTPDAPVQRIVRLVRELDAVCVHQVFSDPVTGEYEFTGFDPLQRYTVLSYDLPGGFRAAIASGVLPEFIP